jgi:energy-coupling factor transporter ATP-binding protein EcfA2
LLTFAYIYLPLFEQVDEAIERFAQHILDVVGNEKVLDFLLDYFASIIQHPEKKTGVVILLQGPQGCGKGTIFDTFREIIGHDASFQTAKPKAQLFGRFSNGLKNRVFVQVDEAKDLTEMDELIKDLATNDRREFEDKGVTPYTLRVYANLVVTSNVDHPVKISDTERRWVAIKCTDKHSVKDSETYYYSLHAFLKKPETVRALFQYFVSRDISHIRNFQAIRPITDYYKECKGVFSSPLDKFLSALCKGFPIGAAAAKDFNKPSELQPNQPPTDFAPSSWLYEKFIDFVQKNRILKSDSLWSTTLFGIKMGEYVAQSESGISKKKGVKANAYIFDTNKLQKYLEEKGMFDEEAEIRDTVTGKAPTGSDDPPRISELGVSNECSKEGVTEGDDAGRTSGP